MKIAIKTKIMMTAMNMMINMMLSMMMIMMLKMMMIMMQTVVTMMTKMTHLASSSLRAVLEASTSPRPRSSFSTAWGRGGEEERPGASSPAEGRGEGRCEG